MTTGPSPYSFDTEAALLDEAIGALRIPSRIVQRVAEPEGCYRVDGGAPLTPGAVVALALDLAPPDDAPDPTELGDAMRVPPSWSYDVIMDKPELPAAGMAPAPRPLPSYTTAELTEIAERCEERRAEGFVVTPDSVGLFAEGLRALARERKIG